METNEGRVYFSLDGHDFEPSEITEFLGIKPTTVKIKGSIVAGKIPKMNSWQLSTDNIVNEYIDVFDMSTEIINKLKPVKKQLIEAKQRFNVSPRF
ncbi:DUF4279 domain-containing protein [Photobacterium sp. J15]|uniref:DUF4279 domain-containing protein n=1 Tax=Photobacterium sp. J15 TaxID=265901 RepID=UPI000A45D5AC|nr:DUF4279 domain-containing protein [Photobacterium sp. J15]